LRFSPHVERQNVIAQESMKVVLQVLDAENAFIELETPEVEGYIVGRSESQSPVSPDVDLVNYYARERGVSRRHAAFVRFRGDIHLLDLGSVNGTFVNSTRLSPDTPHLLNEGDRITFGELNLVVVRKEP
jgi:pSer/pThr/pTyr-binding forkhead associated (FHA) protein